MRTLRTTTIRTLGFTALFGIAQVGAAVFLLRRFESRHAFGGLEQGLIIGVVLLLAFAEMLAVVGGAGPD